MYSLVKLYYVFVCLIKFLYLRSLLSCQLYLSAAPLWYYALVKQRFNPCIMVYIWNNLILVFFSKEVKWVSALYLRSLDTVLWLSASQHVVSKYSSNSQCFKTVEDESTFLFLEFWCVINNREKIGAEVRGQ